MSTHRHRMPSHCSLPAHQVECVGRILKTQLTDLQQGKKPSLTYDLHHTRLNTAINVFKKKNEARQRKVNIRTYAVPCTL